MDLNNHSPPTTRPQAERWLCDEGAGAEIKGSFRNDRQRSLDTLASATFASPRDRAVFYSSEDEGTAASWTRDAVSLNCRLVEWFVEEENAKLGYDMRKAGQTAAEGLLYVSMHQLAEGRALYALIQPAPDQPRLVMFRGRLFRNDSFAATSALIDAVEDAFSAQASGTVTVAADNSRPDTFFRRIAHPNLMRNERVTRVRVLSAADDAASEASGRPRLVQRIFAKETWDRWQRDRWLETAIRNLSPRQERDPAARLEHKVRFLGELHHICARLELLEPAAGADPAAAREFRAEWRRLTRAARAAAADLSLIEPASDGAAWDRFGRFVLRDAYRCANQPAEERLDHYFASPIDEPLFAASAAARMREYVARALGPAPRGGAAV